MSDHDDPVALFGTVQHLEIVAVLKPDVETNTRGKTVPDDKDVREAIVIDDRFLRHKYRRRVCRCDDVGGDEHPWSKLGGRIVQLERHFESPASRVYDRTDPFDVAVEGLTGEEVGRNLRILTFGDKPHITARHVDLGDKTLQIDQAVELAGRRNPITELHAAFGHDPVHG